VNPAYRLPREQSTVFDGALLLAMINDILTKSSVTDRARVDEHVSTLITQLTVVEQILSAIRTQRPRLVSDVETIGIDRLLNSKSRQRKCVNMVPNDAELVYEIGGLLEIFGSAVWPKGVRNEDWLRHATVSREKLAAVWQGLREARKRAQSALCQLTQDEIDEDMLLFRAAESEENLLELEAERLGVEKLVASRKAKESAGEPSLIATFQDVSLSEKVALDVFRRKEKAKTRPSQPQQGEHTPAAETAVERIVPELPPLVVSANNLSLFKRMYPTPNHAPAKVPVDWKHFLQAMVDAGFAVAQSRGSAVMFSKTEGSIVFHRPHPDPKIDPVRLQAMGKRLRKWFGWAREVFVAQGKDGAGVDTGS